MYKRGDAGHNSVTALWAGPSSRTRVRVYKDTPLLRTYVTCIQYPWNMAASLPLNTHFCNKKMSLLVGRHEKFFSITLGSQWRPLPTLWATSILISTWTDDRHDAMTNWVSSYHRLGPLYIAIIRPTDARIILICDARSANWVICASVKMCHF